LETNYGNATPAAQLCMVLRLGHYMGKNLESFAMWCWGRMKMISWINHVKNYVLQRVKEKRTSSIQ
jgi:hypothetical protein